MASSASVGSAPSAGSSCQAHGAPLQKVGAAVAQSAADLGAKKIGALIVLERDTGLNDTAETGVKLDAELSPELLETLFTPHAPLHDGAVIIRHERVIAAGVTLPLSETGAYRAGWARATAPRSASPSRPTR